MPRRLTSFDWVDNSVARPAFKPYGRHDLTEEIIDRVQGAIRRLSASEQHFVRLYWFEAWSDKELSERLGSGPKRLRSVKRQILIKLRWMLQGWAAQRFRIAQPRGPDCVICGHPLRSEIDSMLSSKKPEESLGSVLRKLREDFGLSISTPQIVLGHMKYHMISGENDG
jgi:hypothetical protein